MWEGSYGGLFGGLRQEAFLEGRRMRLLGIGLFEYVMLFGLLVYIQLSGLNVQKSGGCYACTKTCILET